MPLRSPKTVGIAVIIAAILASAILMGTRTTPVRAAVSRPGASQTGALAARTLNRISESQSRRSPRALTNVHFILNWLPNVEFAGLWVAETKGWFRQAGIHMTFTPYSQSVHPETDVADRGGNTFGFQSGAAIIIARSKGVPIKALYTDTQKSVFGLTVLAKSKIYKITDLRGKRVGYQPHELYVPSTMLSHAGLKQSEWTPTPVLFDTVQLTSGQVDAFLTFLNNEPIELKLHGVQTRSFAAADYGFKTYDDVMFTTDSMIQQRPALVRKIVGIVARGFAWAHSHHKLATDITVRKYFPAAKGKSAALNRQQQLLELQAFDRFSRDSRGKFSGVMRAGPWQANMNALFKYGEIKNKVNVNQLFTNRFNPYRY